MRYPRQGVRVPVLLGVGLTAVSLLALGAAAKSPAPHRAAPLASNGRYTSRLLVGTAVGSDRVLRGVDGVFPSTVRRLTAGLVVVGAPAGTTATITWSREGARGEQTLFQQQAKIRARGVLYASARSEHVPLGVYRVHVSLAGDRRDAVFVVAPPTVAARATGVEKSAPAARTLQGAVGSAGDDLQPSGTAEEPLPDPCADFTKPEDIKDCHDWWGIPNGPPPSGGGEPPPNSPPCDSTAHVSLFGSQEIWQFGGYVDLYSNVLFCDEQRTETLAAGVGGAAPGTVKSESGELHWAGDTCDVPGRSDLFANVVHGQLTVEGSTAIVPDDITLYEFGPIPAPVSASPAVGSLVKPGQRIQLTIAAVVEGATRGIKTLEIRDPNGAVLARGGRKSPAGPCQKPLSRFMALASASYKVSRNPPPVIELTLFAETFDGSHVELPLRYRTRPVWSGVLKARLDQKVQPGLQIQEYTADVLVWETEPGKLEGELRGQYKQTLELAKCPSETTAPGRADAALSGTIDSQGMHLKLGSPASTPPTVTPCQDGGQPALMPSPLLIDDLPGLLSKVAPSGNGRYYEAEAYTDPAGLYTVRSNVQLDAGADISADSPLLDMGLADPRTGSR